MKIYELQERTTLLPVLLTIWEDSVRATHHFLSDTEIEQIPGICSTGVTKCVPSACCTK